LKEVNLNELNRILFKQPKNLSYNFNILA